VFKKLASDFGGKVRAFVNFHITHTSGLHYENKYRSKEELLPASNILLRTYNIHWGTAVCRPTGEIVQWRNKAINIRHFAAFLMLIQPTSMAKYVTNVPKQQQ
jgi:hypothetical protein